MQKLQQLSWVKKSLIGLGVILALFVFLIIGLRLAYFGRIYPGVSANGVYLGGLTTADAQKELQKQTTKYADQPQSLSFANKTVTVSANDLGATYNNAVASNQALMIGRGGNIFENISAQVAALVGRQTPIAVVSFDPNKISDFLVSQNQALSQPVQNSAINFTDGNVTISESLAGNRLNLYTTQLWLASYFGSQNNKPGVVPLFQVQPTISSSQLKTYTNLWQAINTQPITLSYAGNSWKIDSNTVANWLAATPTDLPLKKDILTNYYTPPSENSSTYFDSLKIAAWVKDLAGKINTEPQDAELTIVDGRATVFAQSRNGLQLDEATTISAITSYLNSQTTNGQIALSVKTIPAAVSNENIDKLGIKELISEGVTYFPGSPANRLQNVRTGAKKFNGVLLKPGQVFSFGEYLGEVSAATGYAPGLIILGDHEEKAYGGGLCQVSSTAYRAALLAGLPILQRTNHAFAISYYTAPYGVPGVDATIYYPQVDMKFLNDTGHYILIQTQMYGTTLKFDFYGTKTKSGVIRGPEYISGNADPTIPSHTVFYRDVLDLNGKVTKTDTIHTYYQSSLDFPITD
ncbi:MAG: VanW family protein [Candidatus Saccharibacteria bacterium]